MRIVCTSYVHVVPCLMKCKVQQETAEEEGLKRKDLQEAGLSIPISIIHVTTRHAHNTFQWCSCGALLDEMQGTAGDRSGRRAGKKVPARSST